ncbi:ABC transporter, ATP-binding protein [Ancylostoma ceylanicum]|uniref:ABC-type xenobiotic transporter n=1 Tax=Ancylostoma ceylanicum TaxID=53326 RepID=A0A0D6M3A1_9BILA|nr:ABC transporter, ATP-binding protein [Ancylostoma ceylanicum]
MLREKPKIDSLSPLGKTITLQGSIRFSRLFFSYPVSRRNMVLTGINLKIPAGKTVAFVGPSGCGKSTSIQLIERFYDPVVGKVVRMTRLFEAMPSYKLQSLFDEEDARELNLKHLRSQISLVGQEPILFNYSIRENIAYGVENPTDKEIEDAAKLSNAHSFIAKLPNGYNTIVGERGGMLSGGQKQRIAIARAVIRNPKILLLDEATSALDTESEKIVQEALERAREGRTCIVIAHRLSSIQNADLIVVLKDGNVEIRPCCVSDPLRTVELDETKLGAREELSCNAPDEYYSTVTPAAFFTTTPSLVGSKCYEFSNPITESA